MNERTIIFKQGEENGIVIEREKFESSIFLNQYQQAINIFQRLWTKQNFAITCIRMALSATALNM